MNESKKLLLRMIDEAYYKHTWHGTNLRGSIRGLTFNQASWRPSAGRHNIWEIVLHTAYWKYAVRRRLLNEKRGSFPLKGSNWFKRSSEFGEKIWKADVKLLDEMHKSLLKAVSEMNPSELRKKPSNSKFSNESIIFGIANHDIYHAGQIQLIKRLLK